MLPKFLLEETIAQQDGSGPVAALGDSSGKPVLLTLGINRITEQESLDVSISGSADGENWGTEPLLAFPQKFYCGTYTLLLDLGQRPDVRFLRVQWKMARWGRGVPTPLFGFYVFAENAESRPAIAVA
jgi:hypothetical protein